MQAASLLIEANNLQRFYGNNVAVDNVNLELKAGEILGLLGPNGAGKSTILQIIAGTLAPHAGTVLINGVDLKEQPLEARSQIGYLPETPPLYRDMTILEYLNYCGKLHKLSLSSRRSITNLQPPLGLGTSKAGAPHSEVMGRTIPSSRNS